MSALVERLDAVAYIIQAITDMAETFGYEEDDLDFAISYAIDRGIKEKEIFIMEHDTETFIDSFCNVQKEYAIPKEYLHEAFCFVSADLATDGESWSQ